MKTKATKRMSPSDDELFKIFNDIVLDEISLEDAINEANRAYTLISKDALYRNNDFLDMEDE